MRKTLATASTALVFALACNSIHAEESAAAACTVVGTDWHGMDAEGRLQVELRLRADGYQPWRDAVAPLIARHCGPADEMIARAPAAGPVTAPVAAAPAPVQPVRVASMATITPATVTVARVRVAAPIEMPSVLRPAPIPQQALAMAPVPVAAAPEVTASAPPRPTTTRGGWIIQLGAYPEPEKAQDRIREAQTMAKDMLANAEPFTEVVMKGSVELHRARFAGFNQGEAEAACSYFKRKAVDCLFMKR